MNTYFLALYLLSLLFTFGAAQLTRTTCEGDEMQTVLLRWDNTTGEFILVRRYSENDTVDNGAGHFRKLLFSDTNESSPGDHQLRGYGNEGGVMGVTTRRLIKRFPLGYELESESDDTNTTDSDLFVARECSCLNYDLFPEETIYCPMATTSCHELIRQEESEGFGSQFTREGILCERPPPDDTLHSFTDIAALICLAWFVILSCSCVLTQQGRRACNYIPSSLFGDCWNQSYVDYLVRYDADVAGEMVQTHRRLQRAEIERRANEALNLLRQNITNVPLQVEQGEGTGESKPISLALRTRVWHRDDPPSFPSASKEENGEKTTEQDNEQDDYDNQCIICMIPLSDGDRVGHLPCRHIFHSDCLKLWLRRCNACPLCKQEKVAIPRYRETEEENGSTEEQETPSPTTE